MTRPDSPVSRIVRPAELELGDDVRSGATPPLDEAEYRGAYAEFESIGVRGPGRVPDAVGPLQTLSQHLGSRESDLSRRMLRAVESRDMNAMLGVAKDLSDATVEGDVSFKLIAKSVSAIDQLTKMN